ISNPEQISFQQFFIIIFYNLNLIMDQIDDFPFSFHRMIEY
ncbi:hypothetical protein SNEBB_004481, partial [Seison nebaliae]